MILLIDNYDSFSYNLYQLIGGIDPSISVVRNDEKSLKEIEEINPSHIIISPGPGRPEDAGICVEAIAYFAGKIPILGVCLGHQAICAAFGSVVGYAKELMHGKASEIELDLTCPIFHGLPRVITAARYHSLATKKETVPEHLTVAARDLTDGEIMAVKHRDFEVYGVQFHPESILTPKGKTIIENFLKRTERNKI